MRFERGVDKLLLYLRCIVRISVQCPLTLSVTGVAAFC